MSRIKSCIRCSLVPTLVLLVVLSAFIPQSSCSNAQSTAPNQQQAEVAGQDAYSSILIAEDAGANVTSLVLEFNSGLTLEQAGNYTQAIPVFQSISNQSNVLAMAARNSQQFNTTVIYTLILVIPASIGIGTYGGLKAHEEIKLRRIIQMRVGPKVEQSEKED
jgi:hypothetical protein